MQLDPLKNSVRSFLIWRKAEDYRANVKTRFAGVAHIGKFWAIAPDHKLAYFHAVEDFSSPVWDSKKDGRGRDATGYWADNFQNDCVRWCVVKIAPANKKRNRAALFAPITYHDESEGVTLHLDCAGDEKDAQRWGEQAAEREAEECREEDAKFQAEQQICEKEDEAYNLLLYTKRIIAGLRASTLHPDICANIRHYIADNHEALRACIRRIQELRADYWLAVNAY